MRRSISFERVWRLSKSTRQQHIHSTVQRRSERSKQAYQRHNRYKVQNKLIKESSWNHDTWFELDIDTAICNRESGPNEILSKFHIQ